MAKVRLKPNDMCISNCQPLFWLTERVKSNDISIINLMGYNEREKWVDNDYEYELIYKDDKYALIKNEELKYDNVFCVNVEYIVEADLKVGDWVKIDDVGCIYTTYESFFAENKKELGKDFVRLLARWQWNVDLEEDDDREYLIEFIGEHSTTRKKVMIVSERYTGKVYLVGADGLVRLK